MKSIALWSRDHIIAARTLIVVCRVIMFCLAWYIGSEFQKNHILIAPSVFWLFSTLFLIITFLFSNSYSSFRFYKRKLLDGLIVVCSCMMVISLANQKSDHCFNFYEPLQGSFAEKKVKASEIPSKPSVRALRKQLKALKMMTKKGGGASAGGVALAILAAVALGMLLAAAACSLSCNGQDGLAILLLIGGITAIFFICRLIIRATRKKDVVSVNPF
jgi:hypothetical protein